MTGGDDATPAAPNLRLSRTNQNLWNAFIGHARAKRLYNSYASKAMLDGYPEIAEAFLRVARAPDAFPVNILSAVDELRSTRENLQSVVQSHAYDTETLYPQMLAEAEAEGRTDAINRIRQAMERDKHDLQILRSAFAAEGWETGGARVAEPPEAGDAGEFVDEEMARATEEILRSRQRVSSLGRVREVIFGMQDGLISTAVLVSSVYGATQDNFVTIIAGLAGGLGGVVSMATGSYLSSQAEREIKMAEITNASSDFYVARSDVLARLVVLLRNDGLSEEAAVLVAETLGQSESVLLNTVIEKGLGLSADVDTVPWKDALAMGASFFVGAAIPIVPYFFLQGALAVWTSLFATGFSLFIMGAAKTRFTRRNPVMSGLEILGIGIASAVLGYTLGSVIPMLFNA